MHKPGKIHHYSFSSTKLFFLLIVIALSISTVNADVFPEPAYLSLKAENQVEKFPAEDVWEGGPNMLYNALTPNGKVLLVTSPNTATVYAFDTNNGKQLAKIRVGQASKEVKISPDGKEAYVSNEGDNSISVVDMKTFNVVATIATEKMPHNVRFNADGSRAYVTLQGGAGLGVIDTSTRKVLKVIPVPGLTGPHNLDLSGDEKIAFVRDIAGNVAVMDIASGKVKKVIKVGKGHAGIDVIPSGQYVFTGAIADDVVTVIDAKTLAVVKKINVGFGPHGVRASKDNRWLYVTVTGANKFVVIDINTLEIAKKYSVGKFPFWVSVNGNP